MKTIIVPTDYSGSSRTTIAYAAHLAQQTGATLVLYHAFFVPVSATELPVQLPAAEVLMEDNIGKLQQLGNEIKQQYQVEVDCYASALPLDDELVKLVLKTRADLVVMGRHQVSGWERSLFGSSLAEVLKKAFFPVLIIPQESDFHPLTRFLFACDYAFIPSAASLALLQELLKVFRAQLQVAYIDTSYTTQEKQGRNTAARLDKLSVAANPRYIWLEADDVLEGIAQALQQHEADLLVMAPHKHSFLDYLFGRSNTMKMALDIDMPLLVLPLGPGK